MSRIHSFDYIRVVALLGILTCYSLFLFDGRDWLGRYFAQCFNFVFLILSAFLLGLSWQRRGYSAYPLGFLKHRFTKLTWSYYPFLMILFVFLFFVGYSFALKDVLMYVAYLAWFDKIPGFAHVWFLTMIAIAYAGIFLYSHFYNAEVRRKSNRLRWEYLNWLILILTVAIMHTAMTHYNLPGYMIVYLVLYVIVFKSSGRLLQIIGDLSLGLLIIIAIISHGSSLIAYKHGLFGNMYISPIVGIINGITLFAVLFRLFTVCRQNAVIAFISGVSFEAYLMHEFFLYNRGVYGIIIPPPINFLILCCLVIVSGWGLKMIVKILQKIPKFIKN